MITSSSSGCIGLGSRCGGTVGPLLAGVGRIASRIRSWRRGSTAYSPVNCGRLRITNRFFGINLVPILCFDFGLNRSSTEARTRGFFFLGTVPMGDFFGRNTLISLEIIWQRHVNHCLHLQSRYLRAHTPPPPSVQGLPLTLLWLRGALPPTLQPDGEEFALLPPDQQGNLRNPCSNALRSVEESTADASW